MTRWLSPSEQTLWRLWLAANASLHEAIEEDLGTHDLTEADYEVLAHLSEAPDGRLRMTELARTVLLSRSHLTYRVGRLEERGLVERHACTIDARGIEALITRSGRRLITRASVGHVETVRRALIDHLRPDTIRALTRDLTQIADARAHLTSRAD